MLAWTQPLLKGNSIGLMGLISQKFDGILHFLVQSRIGAGCLDIIELVPTVCTRNVDVTPFPEFYEFFLNAPNQQVKYSVILSEEGGRLYHLQNKYMILELPCFTISKVPDNYIWMTLNQIMTLLKSENCISIEIRTLLSCIFYSFY